MTEQPPMDNKQTDASLSLVTLTTEQAIKEMEKNFEPQAANNLLDRIFNDARMDKVKQSFDEIFNVTTE